MKSVRLLPLVFASAPVLALLSHNAGQAHISEAVAPMLAVIVGAYALYALFAALLRSEARAGILVALALLVTFSYQHLSRAAGLPNRVLIPAAVALFLVVAWVLKRGRTEPVAWVRVTLVFGIVQCALPIGSLVVYASARSATPTAVEIDTTVEFEAGNARAPYRPDIYYIILDRYTDAGTLDRDFGYDNQGFLDGLIDNGFYVAGDSRANYLVTSLSLASSLNLTHLEFLTEAMGRESTDWFPLHEMMQSNRVWKFLRSEGYAFYHLGPGWAPTATNGNADRNYQYQTMPEFSLMLCQTTIVYPLLQRLGWLHPGKEKWTRITRQFEDIGKIAAEADGRPHYVFAHFLLPHSPYVFAADGSYLDPGLAAGSAEADLYLGQVRAVNGLVAELVGRILGAAGGDSPPVIIVQGDEGPYPQRTKPLTFDWTQATAVEFSQKMRILNAIHAPLATGTLYPGVTPVNTFRIVFNAYFDTGLPLLPDRSYAYRDLDHLYDFIEVTDQINSVSP